MCDEGILSAYKGTDLDFAYIRPQPGDIVVCYYNYQEIDVESMRDIHEFLVKTFDGNKLISLPDATYLIDYDKPVFAQEISGLLKEVFGEEEYRKFLEAELQALS